jgi:hypothetical protein
LRAKLELIESENERLKGELGRRPPVLASQQLSLLDTVSRSDLKTDRAGGLSESQPDTEAQEVLTFENAKPLGEFPDLKSENSKKTDLMELSHSKGKPICPQCGSAKVKANGNRHRKNGEVIIGEDGQPLKRYKCKDCGKNF